MFRDMRREGQLDENAVDRRVIVGPGDRLEQLELGDGLGELDGVAQDVCLRRQLVLGLSSQSIPLQQPSTSCEYRYLDSISSAPGQCTPGQCGPLT